MPLGIYTSNAFRNAAGVQVVASANVEVRRESDGALADIFSARDGDSNTGIDQVAYPGTTGFKADADGYFEFYAEGIEGGYRVRVYSDDLSLDKTLRYQPTGTARELDASTYGGSLMEAADAAAARTLLNVYSEAEADAAADAAAEVVVEATVPALFRGFISGLVMSNNGTDAEHDIDISAGVACADDQSAMLSLAAALTKRIDAAWAVGTGNGGLDTGSVANATWYYIWLIRRSDSEVVDALFSTSPSAPTMPADYDQKRLIGAVLTDGSANILAFSAIETAGGGLRSEWVDPPLDVSVTNQGTSTTSRALSVPVLPVVALMNGFVQHGSSQVGLYVRNPAVNDEAASNSAAPLGSLYGGASGDPVGGQVQVKTSTGAVTTYTTQTSSTVRLATLGWEWSRR